MNIIPLGRKISKGYSRSPSKTSDNSILPQKSEISDISYVTNVNNIMPVKQNNNIDNFEFDKNSYNIFLLYIILHNISKYIYFSKYKYY